MRRILATLAVAAALAGATAPIVYQDLGASPTVLAGDFTDVYHDL